MHVQRRQTIIISLAVVQLLGALFLYLVSAAAVAGVYKCVDADGGITYAQTPCLNQTTTTVQSSSPGNASEALNCEHANRFALAVARMMQRGNASSDTYASFGGVDAMSKGAVNIVNYVHSFQHSSDISVDRIAALSGNKCKARSFGEVSCESLPGRYLESIGGCGQDAEAQANTATGTTAGAPQTMNLAQFNARDSDTDTTGRQKVAAAQDAAKRDACRSRLEAEIDSINEKMRVGFTSQQGERYRERLRNLRRDVSDC